MLDLMLITLCLVILLIAAYSDIKTLEVPDYLNYSGIAIGLLAHVVYGVQAWSYLPITSSIIGLGIGFAIACLMFYTGQWGGGDAKLLMAMGALIGFEPDKFAFGTSFLINLVFAGGIWVFIYAAILALKDTHKFVRTFKAIRKQKPYVRLRLTSALLTATFILGALLIPVFRFELIFIAALFYALGMLTIFMKSIELCALHQWVTPDKLTEGDWMVHSIKIGSKKLDPPRLGLEKKDLALLNSWHKSKKIDNVLVRYGVPFTPAFLIAFIATLAWGNVLLEITSKLI